MSIFSAAGQRPAFPTKGPFEPGLKNSSFSYPGISIRDWFAGQALIGLCQSEMGDEQFTVSPDLLARTAYSMADAMILARSNRGEEDNG